MTGPSSVSSIASTRSKLGREDIKWAELLQHFRTVQNKHEKARRPALGADDMIPMAEFSTASNSTPSTNGIGPRPALRRKATGDSTTTVTAVRPPPRALSPLNPRARGQSALSAALSGTPPISPTSASQMQQQQKSKRTLSVSRTK